MKKAVLLLAALLLVFASSAGNGFGQASVGPFKMPDAGGKVLRDRPKGRPVKPALPAFAGKVMEVHVSFRTFSVKGRQSTVTFDASHPVFSGYSTLSDMRPGETVAVFYTADGIKVVRRGGGSERQGRGSPKASPGPSRRLARWQPQAGRGSFDKADANKDGKVSPVELSAVIPDITRDEFSRYDKNHDGFLNRAEFGEALSHRGTGKAD